MDVYLIPNKRVVTFEIKLLEVRPELSYLGLLH